MYTNISGKKLFISLVFFFISLPSLVVANEDVILMGNINQLEWTDPEIPSFSAPFFEVGEKIVNSVINFKPFKIDKAQEKHIQDGHKKKSQEARKKFREYYDDADNEESRKAHSSGGESKAQHFSSDSKVTPLKVKKGVKMPSFTKELGKTKQVKKGGKRVEEKSEGDQKKKDKKKPIWISGGLCGCCVMRCWDDLSGRQNRGQPEEKVLEWECFYHVLGGFKKRPSEEASGVNYSRFFRTKDRGMFGVLYADNAEKFLCGIHEDEIQGVNFHYDVASCKKSLKCLLGCLDDIETLEIAGGLLKTEGKIYLGKEGVSDELRKKIETYIKIASELPKFFEKKNLRSPEGHNYRIAAKICYEAFSGNPEATVEDCFDEIMDGLVVAVWCDYVASRSHIIFKSAQACHEYCKQKGCEDIVEITKKAKEDIFKKFALLDLCFDDRVFVDDLCELIGTMLEKFHVAGSTTWCVRVPSGVDWPKMYGILRICGALLEYYKGKEVSDYGFDWYATIRGYEKLYKEVVECEEDGFDKFGWVEVLTSYSGPDCLKADRIIVSFLKEAGFSEEFLLKLEEEVSNKRKAQFQEKEKHKRMSEEKEGETSSGEEETGNNEGWLRWFGTTIVDIFRMPESGSNLEEDEED